MNFIIPIDQTFVILHFAGSPLMPKQGSSTQLCDLLASRTDARSIPKG